MIQWSHSRVETFENCPFRYKLKYIDGLDTLPSDDPQSPLIVGTMVHHAIENGIDEAITEYEMSYSLINDIHINEEMKVKELIPQVYDYLGMLESFGSKFEFEHEINIPEFKGYIDLLVNTLENHYDIYDFKYSNNEEHYLNSKQLHLYKDYLFKNEKKIVDNLYLLFIPKTMIRQKKTEDLLQFRKRLLATLKDMKVKVVRVKYDEQKVDEFKALTKKIENAKEFPKCESRLCDFCEFKDYCQSNGEIDWMIINKKEKGEN